LAGFGGAAAEVHRAAKLRRRTEAARAQEGEELCVREGVENAKKGGRSGFPLYRKRRKWAENRWAAMVRTVGHHVARRYTRGK
jgi:hypothetical protein